MLVVNGEAFGSHLWPGAGKGGRRPTSSSFFPAFKSPGRFQVEKQPSFRRIIQTILTEFKCLWSTPASRWRSSASHVKEWSTLSSPLPHLFTPATPCGPSSPGLLKTPFVPNPMDTLKSLFPGCLVGDRPLLETILSAPETLRFCFSFSGIRTFVPLPGLFLCLSTKSCCLEIFPWTMVLGCLGNLIQSQTLPTTSMWRTYES